MFPIPVHATIEEAICIAAVNAICWPAFNISTRKVGAIRWLKIGRLCVSFCITRTYRPL